MRKPLIAYLAPIAVGATALAAILATSTAAEAHCWRSCRNFPLVRTPWGYGGLVQGGWGLGGPANAPWVGGSVFGVTAYGPYPYGPFPNGFK
jgi:hypothetical protein